MMSNIYAASWNKLPRVKTIHDLMFLVMETSIV
jgi:hypothetical protein